MRADAKRFTIALDAGSELGIDFGDWQGDEDSLSFEFDFDGDRDEEFFWPDEGSWLDDDDAP